MQHHVKLAVTPCIRLDCKFSLEDDGWNATMECLGITVHSPTFETAKNDMELALGKLVEELLNERSMRSRGNAA